MKTSLFCLFLSIALPWFAGAQSAREQALAATAAARAGDFKTAITTYEALLSEGYTSADLHYNLGLAYYRDGRLGPAILHLQKARRLAPLRRDVRQNLERIRLDQADALPPLPTFFLRRWWVNLSSLLAPRAWSVLGIALIWLGAAGLLVWLLGRGRSRKRLGLLVGGLCLLSALPPLLLSLTRSHELSRRDVAIVLSPQVELKIAPGDDADRALDVHEGLWVRILDEYEGWYKVELVDGRQGWAPAEDVSPI